MVNNNDGYLQFYQAQVVIRNEYEAGIPLQKLTLIRVLQ